MADVYQITVNGTCLGQDIVNIFYYGLADGTSVSATQTAMDIVANGFITEVVPSYRALLSNTHNVDSIRVGVVNENRNVVSDFDIDYSIQQLGTDAQALGSSGQCAVLAFKCTRYNDAQTYRVPKRSYLAIGPVAEIYVEPGGNLSAGYTTKLLALANVLVGTPIGQLGGIDLVSTRVGVPNATGVGALGRVVSAIARPFSSFRRSRMRSPKGV